MKAMAYESKKKYIGFAFTIPWLLGAVFFFVIPFFSTFMYSLNQVTIDIGSIKLSFLGLSGYTQALTSDVRFITALIESVQVVLLQLPLIIVMSVTIAVILNSKIRGRLVVRGIFFLPVIIASGVIIYILKTENLATSMTSGSRSSMLFQGLEFSTILLSYGMPANIVNAIMQLVNGIFELVWKSGVQVLLFLAGLQSVPRYFYEAAEIEGATGWERFWSVTIPTISPTILLCAFYTIVDTSTDYSNSVIRYIKELAKDQNITKSAVLSCLWFFIIMAIVFIVFMLMKRNVHYMNDKG